MSKIARFNSIVNAAIATLILASCSDVYEGIVFEKRHEPLSVSTVMQTVAIINGQSVTVMLVPTQVIDDEDWVITIEGYSRKKAAVRRRDVYVSPGEYEAVNVFRRLNFPF